MQLNLKTHLLSQIAPFSALENEAVRLLAFDGEEMALEPQAELFRQGETADGGYAMLSGTIALEREGDIPTPVRLVGAGSLIGLSALIVAGERPATATVREKVLLLRLPRQLMLRVLEAFPDSAVAFRRYIEGNLAEQANALERVAGAIDVVENAYRSRESRTGT
jgi:CRP-like cAMP-binding protein